MIIAAIVFFLIGAAVIAGALIKRHLAEIAAERRLGLLEPPGAPRRGDEEQTLREETKFDRLMRSIFSVGLKRSWAWRSSGLILLAIACGAMAAVWIVASWFSGLPEWAGAALGLIAFFVAPRVKLLMEKAETERQFIDAFPDAIEMIVRMLRAGLPVTATIDAVAKESAFPVNRVFSDIADRLTIGVGFEDALHAVAEHIKLSDFRFFSVAASLQRTTGGNLAATLESLSNVIRKKRALRLKARAVTAEVRMTAYVLGGIPFLIVGELLLTHPEYLAPLIADPRGNVIVGLSVGLLALAFLVIRQMMRSVMRAR